MPPLHWKIPATIQHLNYFMMLSVCAMRVKCLTSNDTTVCDMGGVCWVLE